MSGGNPNPNPNPNHFLLLAGRVFYADWQALNLNFHIFEGGNEWGESNCAFVPFLEPVSSEHRLLKLQQKVR